MPDTSRPGCSAMTLISSDAEHVHAPDRVLVGLHLERVRVGDRPGVDVGARVAGVEEGDVGAREGALGVHGEPVDLLVVQLVVGVADDPVGQRRHPLAVALDERRAGPGRA